MQIIFAIAAVLIGLVFSVSHAETTYLTKRGFKFIQVEDEKFGLTWKAPDGSVWSQYRGMFSNTGNIKPPDGNEVDHEFDYVIIDSPAAQACDKIGGALPRIAQYKVFLEYFLNTADYHAIFPAPAKASGIFWSSNAVFNDGIAARAVKTKPGIDAYGDATWAKEVYSVLCVHQ